MTELIHDRYEPLDVVGEGGEGRLVKALDLQHDRFVALKLRAVATDAGRELVLNEARALLALPPHANLALVRDGFFEDDQYVIVMDWVEGVDLGRVLQTRGRPGLSPSSVVAWLAEAADALTYLHTRDPPVVHGDVKPANLVLTHGGHIVLVDYGVSTVSGSRTNGLGTPGFTAPELLTEAPSRASDVYALAATAFTLLAGAPPTSVLSTWDGINPEQTAALETAIRAGLATDPARRPATPGEFVERLRAGWGSTLPTGVLTFCLSDIEGSTQAWESDPSSMARALVRHDQIIAETVESHGGRFLKSMGEGDATVSVFSAAEQAVAATIDCQGRLVDEGWPGDLAIRVRMALHTGEAEQRGGDYFGPTLNVGARIRALADGNQVFVSGVTAAAVADAMPSGATLVDLGPHRLRGVTERVPVFAIAAPGVDAPPSCSECPYQGLLSFDVGDSARFFGRSVVVNDLVARVQDVGFVALVGSSGGVCAVMVASAAMANVPDPTNSTCPSWIFITGTFNSAPDGGGPAGQPVARGTIIVRDFASNPISGAITEINFRNACDINLCPVVSSADVAEFSTVIDCDSSIVRGNTNAAGEFSFTVVGGAKAPIAANTSGTGKVGSVIVFANDKKLCSVTAVARTLNDARPGGPVGNQSINGGDIGDLGADLGAYQLSMGNPAFYAGRADHSCNAQIDGGDIGILGASVGRYTSPGFGGCPGGLAALCKTNKCPAPF